MGPSSAYPTLSTPASMCFIVRNVIAQISRPERDGYSYEVTCLSGADFQVVARHAPAPEGSPIRYPTLAIDSSMQVREIQ